MRNRAEDQITLVLIRHGETQANRERRYLGKTDESLSESGIESLLAYKREHGCPKVDCLFSSPMKRCLETAEILYPDICPMVIPEWEEMDFGQFEYKNYQELKDDSRYQAWIDSGGVLDFPEGESRAHFIARCERGFERMCARLRRMAQDANGSIRAGMIVHGGTIMALMSSHGEKAYFDYQVSNGKGFVCRMKGWGNSARIEDEVRI
ncbi:MAG: histidine phosphatase family protein [Lachnospiraceae bacterium]|nr:histidine phosphatase family protein [Lachnospiraceae bacterium]MCM1239544.1 histidine phosphatase family protein [Lachnospiraceae bacterium]